MRTLAVRSSGRCGVRRRIGGEGPPVGEMAVDRFPLYGHVGDAPAFHLGKEIGIGVAGVAMRRGRILEQVEQGRQQNRDDDPQHQILTEIH